jgi:hypothetical protein
LSEIRLSDGFSVTIVAHSDGPLLNNVTEAIEVRIEIPTGVVDRDELRGSIRDEHRGLPYVLDELYDSQPPALTSGFEPTYPSGLVLGAT